MHNINIVLVIFFGTYASHMWLWTMSDGEVVMLLEPPPLVTGVPVPSNHWKVAELPFTEQIRM